MIPAERLNRYPQAGHACVERNQGTIMDATTRLHPPTLIMEPETWPYL